MRSGQRLKNVSRKKGSGGGVMRERGNRGLKSEGLVGVREVMEVWEVWDIAGGVA